MFRGYWENEQATHEAMTDNWFHTGDVGYIDEEGFLFVVDRIKNLVIRGGENIGCGEIEAAIYEHPKVAESIVFGVPDERMGEELAALITRKTECLLTEEEIRQHLQVHLVALKIPRYLHIQEEPITRLASGKFDRKRVRDQFIGRENLTPS